MFGGPGVYQSDRGRPSESFDSDPARVGQGVRINGIFALAGRVESSISRLDERRQFFRGEDRTGERLASFGDVRMALFQLP